MRPASGPIALGPALGLAAGFTMSNAYASAEWAN
eukprot:CAMPEP_0180317156 /NCGR_PEP_ID=MMETSP0988-20121125/33676_1 /TAXON_ID=697907 /ORGANISM="non described non described, Strain CCMP2293" /LENGTH=33 /DNA_ID= /DNA_START= /DNA_END= /DNA_ORIENTATION=